jgi:hypothetical protein
MCSRLLIIHLRSAAVAALKTTIASCDDWAADQPAIRGGVNRLT